MSDTVEERVARGVKWLDEHEPYWWKKIELIEFDITRGCDCVLGQVFSEHNARTTTGYDWAIMNFDEFAGYGTAAKMGFDCDTSSDDDEYEDYKALQEEWSKVIDERQSC